LLDFFVSVPGADDILVGTDTSGFQSLGGELFIFVGDEVNAEREVVDVGLLTSQIEDTDLGVGNTTVEPGLGVRLYASKLISIHRFPYRIHHIQA
jgi:hypothetical protein